LPDSHPDPDTAVEDDAHGSRRVSSKDLRLSLSQRVAWLGIKTVVFEQLLKQLKSQMRPEKL